MQQAQPSRISSDVYRNARYEARIKASEARVALLELRLVEICASLTWALGAIEQFSKFIELQSDALPGEHRPIERRPH